MRIVIAGGSGQVGTVLARHFHATGHAVVVLSREARPAPWKVVAWDAVHVGPWAGELDGADVCINLAGRSVDCRYNESNRRAMYDSRILATRVLNEAFALLHRPPRVWLNASTATIYRHAMDRSMDEHTGELGGGEPGSDATWDFSIRIAKDWEREFFSVEIPGVRKVAMRSAIMFHPDRRSAFHVLSRLVPLALAGPVAGGKQFVSWVHEADFIRAVEFLIAHEEMSGAVNIASSNPLPNREFMRILRNAWGHFPGLPAPRFAVAVGAWLMRTEPELVLKSRRVVPARLLEAGFEFQYPDWKSAAHELVQRWKRNRRMQRAAGPLLKEAA